MNVNILAVILAAVASMIVGGIWYGPLFGKMYSNAMGWGGMSPEQQKEMMKGMTWNYVGQFIASIVMFYIFGMFMNWMGWTDVMGGIHLALIAWLGFNVTHQFGMTLWGGKKVLFWLGIGSSLIIYLAGGILMGAIR